MTKVTNTNKNDKALNLSNEIRLSQITTAIKKHESVINESFFAIGALLKESRDLVGNFTAWGEYVKTNFNYGTAYACRLINITEKFGGFEWAKGYTARALFELMNCTSDLTELAEECGKLGQALTSNEIKEMKEAAAKEAAAKEAAKAALSGETVPPKETTDPKGAETTPPKADKKETTELRAELKKATDTVARLEAGKQKASDLRDKAVTLARSLKEELEDAKAQLATALKEKTESQTLYVDLCKEHEALKAQFAAMSSELEALKAAPVATVLVEEEAADAEEVEEMTEAATDLPWEDEEEEEEDYSDLFGFDAPEVEIVEEEEEAAEEDADALKTSLLAFYEAYKAAGNPRQFKKNTTDAAVSTGWAVEVLAGGVETFVKHGTVYTGAELRNAALAATKE